MLPTVSGDVPNTVDMDMSGLLMDWSLYWEGNIHPADIMNSAGYGMN